MRNICSGTTNRICRRSVWVSSTAWPGPAFIGGASAGSVALEQLRNEPTLEWSHLAPSAAMQPERQTAHFRLGGDRLLVGASGVSSISMQDVALAMIDELERRAHVRQRFTVGY